MEQGEVVVLFMGEVVVLFVDGAEQDVGRVAAHQEMNATNAARYCIQLQLMANAFAEYF